jgi:ABC-2 type transport system permease protein
LSSSYGNRTRPTVAAIMVSDRHLILVIRIRMGLLRHTAAAMSAMVALVFLAYPAVRAFEGSSYLPDHLLLINAATALATVNPPAGPHAGRIPSLGFALFDLALYLAVFLGLGAWRARLDT